MKKNLHFIIINTIIFVTIFAIGAQAKAYVPIIQVTDTLCHLTCDNVGTATGVLFLPDGKTIYCTKWNDETNPGVVAEYDINTLELKSVFCDNEFHSAGDITISPDGQTLAVEVFKDSENESDLKTTQVILIDLTDKTKYTVIESLEPTVYTMTFSPNGKNLAFAYVGATPNIYTCIYNIESKSNKYILKSEMEVLLGEGTCFGNPLFLSDDILILSSSPSDMTWSLNDDEFKKIINFDAICADVNGNKLLLCGHLGDLAILDFGAISVNDSKNLLSSSISYLNNQLEISTDYSITGDLQIYNINGKLLADYSSQSFVAGKSIIPLNQSLPTGIYIVTISNDKETITGKFMIGNKN